MPSRFLFAVSPLNSFASAATSFSGSSGAVCAAVTISLFISPSRRAFYLPARIAATFSWPNSPPLWPPVGLIGNSSLIVASSGVMSHHSLSRLGLAIALSPFVCACYSCITAQSHASNKVRCKGHAKTTAKGDRWLIYYGTPFCPCLGSERRAPSHLASERVGLSRRASPGGGPAGVAIHATDSRELAAVGSADCAVSGFPCGAD